MKITIAYITARDEPHLDWLCDGLEQQARSSDNIELIVVDALGRAATSIGFRPIRPVKKLVETKPKPCIWQGDHRITAHDFFANANARNTAIVLCSTSYICFMDDRCKLDPDWLGAVRRGEKRRNAVLCGTYTKVRHDGTFFDHRREAEPKGKRGCPSEWTYGCNIALPLKWALEVNGFEEGCDPVGVEDCVFGRMLGNAGRRVDFVPELSIQQDRLDSNGYVHPLRFPRYDKGQPPTNKRQVQLDRFYKLKRTEFTPDLTDLRAKIAGGEPFPVPDPSFDYRDWYDAHPIRGAGMSLQELKDRARSPA